MSEPVLLNPLGSDCHCVDHHMPKAYVAALHHIVPQSWGGKTTTLNLVMICPNTHTAVHRLIDEYVRHGGLPGWEIRQHFSVYQRDLASRAWNARPEKPTITSLEHP